MLGPLVHSKSGEELGPWEFGKVSSKLDFRGSYHSEQDRHFAVVGMALEVGEDHIAGGDSDMQFVAGR